MGQLSRAPCDSFSLLRSFPPLRAFAHRLLSAWGSFPFCVHTPHGTTYIRDWSGLFFFCTCKPLIPLVGGVSGTPDLCTKSFPRCKNEELVKNSGPHDNRPGRVLVFCFPLQSIIYSPTPPHPLRSAACLTLGNFDIKGGSDQSHQGGVEVNCVVICYRQVHPQESL